MDVDVVYSRSLENIRALVAALRSYKAHLRGAPLGLPFVFDERTVRMGLDFTLSSELGDLDLLGEVPGGGSYENLDRVRNSFVVLPWSAHNPGTIELLRALLLTDELGSACGDIVGRDRGPVQAIDRSLEDDLNEPWGGEVQPDAIAG